MFHYYDVLGQVLICLGWRQVKTLLEEDVWKRRFEVIDSGSRIVAMSLFFIDYIKMCCKMI